MFSNKTVIGLVSTMVTTAALALPAMAAAGTTVPPLQTGDAQAYASLTAGGPAIAGPVVRHYNNPLTLMVGVTDVSCNASLTSTINPDGTTAVTAATFATPCVSTSFPGCVATMSAASGTPGLSWGGRLVRDSSGAFRQRINIQKLTVTYSGTCGTMPTGVPLSMGGVISPKLGVSSGVSFDYASGRFAFDLGNVGVSPYWSGSLVSPAGEVLYPGV